MRILFSFLFTAVLGVSFGQIEFFGEVQSITRLNSPYDENFLSLHPSGNEIVFTRRSHPGNVGDRHNPGDLWLSVRDSLWSLPKSSVNVHPTKFVTPIGYVNSGAYFLYNTTTFDRGIFKGEVWISTIEEGVLKNPQKIDIDHFSNLSEHQTGCISSDGKHILFSMEANFSFGVEDLYVSHLKSDGSWSAPKNLGYRINTPFQEYTPFLAADRRTLIFSSNGRGGMGSFDLFISERQDESWQNWSEPVNLGSSVNTGGSETSFSFLPGAEYAYFVSTLDSDGYGDVKRIRIKSEITPVPDEVDPFILKEEVVAIGTVFQLIDRNTSESVIGKIEINGEDFEMTINSGDSIQQQSTSDVTISTNAVGYLDKQIQLTSAQWSNADTIKIEIDALEVGNTIQLENVLFHQGTANFIEGSEIELTRVVEMMNDNPSIRIMIKGHTDNVGDPVLNLQLSRERVYVVRDYLIDKGIDFRRIEGKGFGGNQPIAPNDTEENRKLNRRVEFTIVEN